jgi:hypothetical protein
MTKKEMAMLADIISARVVDELLTVIKVRQNYENLGWTSDSTGFEDLYGEYEKLIDEEKAELEESKPKARKKKSKPIKAKPIESEADLIGEMASLMTKKSMYLDNEEYEKITPIVIRIVEVKKLLKDNYNVNMDLGEDIEDEE